MRKVLLSIGCVVSLMACTETDPEPQIIETVAPATYSFERSGASSVSFGGQTTRIEMGGEFVSALKSTSETVASLNAKFAHTAGANNFSDADLNASSKSVRSKVAASTDFYASNTTDATAIKADFDSWIEAQVTEVFPMWDMDASAGNAGQIQEAGGGSIRYVSAKGIEYNQLINKGLIGALMVDQILNNYLSPAVLDAASNVADNDAESLNDGKNYTTMEHKWDEAFGYLYGKEADITAPTLNNDSFLNKYLSRVEGDADFAGIAEEIYNAFKLGRAAIVAKDYTTRNVQAEILREKISEIVGIRAVYYLQQGKNNLPTDKGGAFHDLSEGIGFIYSLQFTRMPNSTASYFTKAEVDEFMATLQNGNGFWDLSSETLDEMSATIAAKFNFTLAQAGS
tara:strand:+ start:571 stop:1764 length:1194 start_codon:yes stop_codon:yes gene_type:complete